MLNKVGVRIDRLVGIARQLAILYRFGRVNVIIAAGLPLRAVAIGTADLHEYLLATLHGFRVQVAGAGDGETAMPDGEGVVVVVLHLGLELVDGVVELVGLRREEDANGVGDAFLRPVGVIRRRGVGFDARDDGRILGHGLSPFVGGAHPRQVRPRDSQLVPEACVLQQGRLGEIVIEAADTLLSVELAVTFGGQTIRSLVPDGGVEGDAILSLAAILGDDGVVRDSIDESETGEAERYQQPHLIA